MALEAALETVLFDTSAYVAFKRGQAEAVEATRHAARILLPVVVIGELLAGFAAGTRQARNLAELEAFCASGRVTITPLSWATAERYAAIYGFLRAAGTPIPTNDLWIAAAAMQHGAALLTADRHFLAVPQVITRWLPTSA